VVEKRRFQPIPRPAQSQLDELYAEFDGPAPLSEKLERSVFELPCREFFFASTWPAYHEWVRDKLPRRSGHRSIPTEKLGGRSRTRTYDPLIKSQLLYHLSYAP
jgi:hypothetical protein